MNKIFGLLGEKLEHSFSPLIHAYLADYSYLLYEICPAELDRFMKQRQFDGINVTIPYKQAVIPYCTVLSDEAQMIGSVNTIIKDSSGLLAGHNTDYHGFRVMLEQAGITVKNKKTLILGSGGSAKTVHAVLSRMEAAEIVTISRSGENNYTNISKHYDAKIIVNTTPVGMYPDNGHSPLSLSDFSDLHGVADIIYNPFRTKLLLEAKQLGIPCVNGLTMLVAQAEMASSLFLDKAERSELVNTIIDAIIKKTLNITLIGMPSCGKSTIGALLAQSLNRQFTDIDTLIKTSAGKTIPEIFRDDGEDRFRRLESRILSDETKKSNTVIATGGGAVTRQENYNLLKQNSIIVYLKRELSDLNANGRPLSQKLGIEELARQRIPLYETWSDYTVPVQAKPENTVSKILEVLKCPAAIQ
jgi:shikimate dehydrogenase